MESVMQFLLEIGSRRQVRFELDSPEALANLNRLSGCSQEKGAHGDTLDHFLGHVPTSGLAISIAQEFIENSDPEASKQDCELKAFARLAPRLKTWRPWPTAAAAVAGRSKTKDSTSRRTAGSIWSMPTAYMTGK